LGTIANLLRIFRSGLTCRAKQGHDVIIAGGSVFNVRAIVGTDISDRHQQQKRHLVGIGETREGNTRLTFRALEIEHEAQLAGHNDRACDEHRQVARGNPIALAFPRSNLVIASSFLLDSFMAQEDHADGRKQATRNVHLMSKGRSMTPPPQIQPR